MSVSAGSLSAEPEVDLTTLRWSLQKGFDESYLNLEKTKLDSSKWKPVKGFPIKIFEHSDERENFATFSLLTYFDLPAQIINNPRQPGIAFGEIGEVFEVYINGNLVAAEGFNRDGKIFHRTVRGVVYEIKPSYLKEKDNQLLIKIQGDPRYEHTGLYLNQFYKIGIYQKLKSASRDTLALVLTGLYLFVGLYHFLLTLKRPQDTYNLYFAICCVLIFIYLMTRDHIVFDFGIDTILIQRTELIVLYAFGVFLNRFVDVMVLGEVSRFVRYYSYLCVLLILPPLLLPMRYGEQPFLMIWQAATIGVMLPRGMYHIAKDSRKGSRDSRRLLMGMTIFAFAAIFDVVDSAYLNTGLAYTKYGFAVFILGIAVILANRFLRVHNEVEELNTNLEQKVEARTAELQNTLEEISNLKEKQDGDYFLTSLLLKPLAKNEVDSDSVNVEFLTRQHKRFHFRKWDEELGGDMSIAHTIVLRDKTYTVFLNGDAMGKSLQGAGGALVLGVVYNSLISRTRSDIHRHLFPEHWIREAYRELQDIFVSFDGSMLISVVIGLLEDETGMLYFLNAEHPEVVLYRNNTAEFLHEKTLRKIGTTGINRFLVVNTFQLKPDDVIFVGSDGRDDILMGLDEEGNRIINDDENEFLKRVEEGRGLLGEIDTILRKQGELTDDFTLVRVGYREDRTPAQKPAIPAGFVDLKKRGQTALDEKNYWNAISVYEKALVLYSDADASLGLARAFFGAKDYERLAQFGAQACLKFPRENEILLLTAQAYRHLKDFDNAAIYGERLFLRDPENLENLVLMAEIYKAQGNKERVLRLLEDMKEVTPVDDATLANFLSKG